LLSSAGVSYGTTYGGGNGANVKVGLNVSKGTQTIGAVTGEIVAEMVDDGTAKGEQNYDSLKGTKTDKSEFLRQNRERGKAFENETIEELRKDSTNIQQEVTVKTESGTKTRLDIVREKSDGTIECVECKSSETAPLTKNQKKAFPEIEKTGASVVGKGKPGFEGGSSIPPTKVKIVRPPKE